MKKLILLILISFKLNAQTSINKNTQLLEQLKTTDVKYFIKNDTIIFKDSIFTYKSTYCIVKNDTGVVHWKLLDKRKLKKPKTNRPKLIY